MAGRGWQASAAGPVSRAAGRPSPRLRPVLSTQVFPPSPECCSPPHRSGRGVTPGPSRTRPTFRGPVRPAGAGCTLGQAPDRLLCHAHCLRSAGPGHPENHVTNEAPLRKPSTTSANQQQPGSPPASPAGPRTSQAHLPPLKSQPRQAALWASTFSSVKWENNSESCREHC